MRFFTHMAGLLAGLLFVGAPALAQNPAPDLAAPKGPQVETHTGTIKAIDKKGRVTVLTLTDSEGTDHVFPLTPKVRFEVQGTGDEGFLAAGQYVEGKGVLTNNNLIVNAVTVYVFGPGKKAPAGGFAKTPAVAGESVDGYQFGGAILGMEPNKDYPDYQHLGVKLPTRNAPPIMLEKGFQINVVSNSPEHAAVGQSVEFDLQPVRGDKFNLVRVIVAASEPFKSEDMLKPARAR